MNTGESALSVGKFLSGLSRTLGVANQVIPLVEQTRPLFKNAKNAYKVIKNIPIKKNDKVTVEKNYVPIPQEKKTTNNSPQFFI